MERVGRLVTGESKSQCKRVTEQRVPCVMLCCSVVFCRVVSCRVVSCRALSVVDRGRSRPTRIPCLASGSFSSWLKLKRRRMDNGM